jgi:hypothetical protein
MVWDFLVKPPAKKAARKTIKLNSSHAVYFSGAALAAAQHARIFDCENLYQSPKLREFLLRSHNAEVVCWFDSDGVRLNLVGNWTRAFPRTAFDVLCLSDKDNTTFTRAVYLRKSDKTQQTKPAAPGILDEYGELTCPSSDIETRVLSSDLVTLKRKVKAACKSENAHQRVPYVVCDGLLELVAKLENNGVSTEAFVKGIDVFLAERGIEKPAR